MMYDARNQQKRRAQTRRTLGVVGVIILILAFFGFFAPHLFSGTVQEISLPFAYTRDSLGNGFFGLFSLIQSKVALSKENTALKTQLTLMNATAAERDMYKDQNTELEELMGVIPAKQKIVIGRIISKPGFSPYDTVVVTAGTQEAVATGDIAYIDTDTAVGYVSSVASRTSTVVLYSSPGEMLNVLIGSSSIEARSTGLGGGTMQVQLPRGVAVSEGDTVIAATSSQTIVGVVFSVSSAATDSFETILIHSPVEISQLAYLFIDETNDR